MFDFQPLNNFVSKNVVEKCGKVLTFSQMLYLCSVFGMKYAITQTSRTII